jgi:hypothetical protein
MSARTIQIKPPKYAEWTFPEAYHGRLYAVRNAKEEAEWSRDTFRFYDILLDGVRIGYARGGREESSETINRIRYVRGHPMRWRGYMGSKRSSPYGKDSLTVAVLDVLEDWINAV